MNSLLSKASELPFGDALSELKAVIESSINRLQTAPGSNARFRESVQQLPCAVPSIIDFSGDAIVIGRDCDMPLKDREKLRSILLDVMPWRKGPFSLFGIHIDCEWRSYMKWKRVAPHLKSLKGKRVLDIGCSNGYYLFKMMESDPELALGIDPHPCFYYQNLILQKYAQVPNFHFLPIGIEELPPLERFFDTVFFMGILYHQSSPVDALKRIMPLIQKGGELVLETLIIPGDDHTALFPEKRYAKMRNVHFIPTVPTLVNFMKRAGLKNIRVVDVCLTTSEEQRKTPWVISESLSDFLDPQDPTKTVEGYPAPVRATVIGEAW